MKRFLAIFLGSAAAFEKSGWATLDEATRKQKEISGIKAWHEWMNVHKAAIVADGGPLGKTKRAAKEGLSDTKNAMSGYVVVQAESHDAAAKMFLNHPQFTLFPGEAVEIMECLPIPGAPS